MEKYFRAKANLMRFTESNKIFVGQCVVDYAKEINFKLPKEINVVSNKIDFLDNNEDSNFFTTQPQRLNLSLIRAFLKKQNVNSRELAGALRSYFPEPHRLQRLEIINDVTFWDDSKATNFASAIAACRNFKGNVLWIGGGKNKGGCIEELAQKIKPLIKKAFLIGESGKVLGKIFKRIGMPYSLCNSLEHAVKQAFLEASAMSNILLSPGFSSFDTFKNYQERGNLFQKFVSEIRAFHNLNITHKIA